MNGRNISVPLGFKEILIHRHGSSAAVIAAAVAAVLADRTDQPWLMVASVGLSVTGGVLAWAQLAAMQQRIHDRSAGTSEVPFPRESVSAPLDPADVLSPAELERLGTRAERLLRFLSHLAGFSSREWRELDQQIRGIAETRRVGTPHRHKHISDALMKASATTSTAEFEALRTMLAAGDGIVTAVAKGVLLPAGASRGAIREVRVMTSAMLVSDRLDSAAWEQIREPFVSLFGREELDLPPRIHQNQDHQARA